MNLLRYTIARWLIHAGIRVMPHGRARREIHDMLTVWGLSMVMRVNSARSVKGLPDTQ
jgi:hypothetical protein